jgi:all-trans-retinol 13,14-reductase
MAAQQPARRDIILAALAAAPFTGLDWEAWPPAPKTAGDPDEFDAVIIGAGLGGLSCAAAFARKAYRPIVIEQHDRPGGYATAFRRKDFLFDASLHSTTVGERNGVRNLIFGFPEITGVEFVPHPHLYRAILPEHDVRVPQRDLPGYAAMLIREFPEERAGIEALIGDMTALSAEIRILARARGAVDMSRFAAEFPMLDRCSRQTWGRWRRRASPARN